MRTHWYNIDNEWSGCYQTLHSGDHWLRKASAQKKRVAIITITPKTCKLMENNWKRIEFVILEKKKKRQLENSFDNSCFGSAWFFH